MRYAIGIDIGGTNTRVALIDENYTINQRVQFPTDTYNPLTTLNKISDVIKSFCVDNIVGIGLSCPGPLDLLNGKVLMSPNLHEEWWHFEISKVLKEQTGLETYLENDANLACLSEACLGAGKDCRYVSFLTVSTGIGAGFCVDKKIYQGAHGFAHEVANMPMWRYGPSHGAIYPGGIEAISSGTAIVNRALAMGLNVKHAGDVYELALKGDMFATMIFEDAREYLANAIASIYALLDPEVVILGGSVSLKVPGFVEDIERRVKSKVFDVMKPYVNIVKTDLNEDSGLIGAACLAFLKTE